MADSRRLQLSLERERRSGRCALRHRQGSLTEEPCLSSTLIIAGRRSSLELRQASPPRRVSSLRAAVTCEQRRAIERLADYPRRVERLKSLWIDFCLEDEDTRRARASGRLADSHGARSLGSSSSSCPVPRGLNIGGPLNASQIRDLMTRDLTPEDYEMLCLLDEGIKKAKVMSPNAAAALPRAAGTSWVNEACSICLCALEEDEDVRMLPACGHFFHAPCAERWLTSNKNNCPLCGREEARQEKVMAAFRRFDQDGDGLFSVAEMKQVLVTLDSEQWCSENVDRVFSLIDTDCDGKVNTQEFVDWLFAARESDADGTAIHAGSTDQERLCITMDI